jgi:hypothetical protein
MGTFLKLLTLLMIALAAGGPMRLCTAGYKRHEILKKFVSTFRGLSAATVQVSSDHNSRHDFTHLISRATAYI